MSMIKNYKSTMIEYKTWYSMIKRCSDKNRLDYKNYGGRGIKVCDKWVSSFDLFFKDMGYRPEGHSLDRIDNNGNYEPSNCRWATSKVQGRNTRNNSVIEYNGDKKCISEWAELLNLKRATLRHRIFISKLPISVALSSSLYETGVINHFSKKVVCHKTGVIYNSISDAARSIGIKVNTLQGYLLGRRPNKTTFDYYYEW